MTDPYTKKNHHNEDHDDCYGEALADIRERRQRVDERIREGDREIADAKEALEALCGCADHQARLADAKQAQLDASSAHARTIGEWDGLVGERQRLSARGSELQRCITELKRQLNDVEVEAMIVQHEIDFVAQRIADTTAQSERNVSEISRASKQVQDLEHEHGSRVHKACARVKRAEESRAALVAEREELESRKKKIERDASYDPTFHAGFTLQDLESRIASSFDAVIHGTYLEERQIAALAQHAAPPSLLVRGTATTTTTTTSTKTTTVVHRRVISAPGAVNFKQSVVLPSIPEEPSSPPPVGTPGACLPKDTPASSLGVPYASRSSHTDFLAGRSYLAGTVLNLAYIPWHAMLEWNVLAPNRRLHDAAFEHRLRKMGAVCVLSIVETAEAHTRDPEGAVASYLEDADQYYQTRRPGEPARRKRDGRKGPLLELMESQARLMTTMYTTGFGDIEEHIDDFVCAMTWQRNRSKVLKALGDCARDMIRHRRWMRDALSRKGPTGAGILLASTQLNFEGRDDMMLELADRIPGA